LIVEAKPLSANDEKFLMAA